MTSREGPRFGIPGTGQAKLWKNESNGALFIVYFIPGADPPIPLGWKVKNESDLESFFGPDQEPVISRTFADNAELNAEGLLRFGSTDLLPATDENPWLGFKRAFRLQAEINPWLLDPEVGPLYASAFIEGRSITEAELKTTDWWQGHNEAERAWLLLSASDPATASGLIEDNQGIVAGMLVSAGISDAPESIAEYMANQHSTGAWSATYLDRQIELLADPAQGARVGTVLDEGLSGVLEGRDLNTNQSREATVRSLAAEWLGPAAGDWSEKRVARWASRIRNEPGAQDELIEVLQGQRMALFPAFTNPQLTYEDVAGPTRALFEATWGTPAPEESNFFMNLVNNPDREDQERRLRRRGLRKGNEKVTREALSEAQSAFGDTVRRPI